MGGFLLVIGRRVTLLLEMGGWPVGWMGFRCVTYLLVWGFGYMHCVKGGEVGKQGDHRECFVEADILG